MQLHYAAHYETRRQESVRTTVLSRHILRPGRPTPRTQRRASNKPFEDLRNAPRFSACSLEGPAADAGVAEALPRDTCQSRKQTFREAEANNATTTEEPSNRKGSMHSLLEKVRRQHGNRRSGGSSVKAKPWARVSDRVGMLVPAPGSRTLRVAAPNFFSEHMNRPTRAATPRTRRGCRQVRY